MSQTVASTSNGHRMLVLRMESEQSIELMRMVGSVLGGAFGIKLYDRILSRWRKKQQEPVELTARILDDGDKFREMLLAENIRVTAESRTNLERAHASEVKLAVLQTDFNRLSSRLDRKDEACRALQQQIIQLGHMPVILTAPAGRADSIT